ncbi:MAG: hypothetical protein HQL93_12635 [Magnetococcales bacterium]|nr:hypothetical protein [Magnetococcales bacterium]
MNHIRTLILALLTVLLVNVFLNETDSSPISMDTLVTLGFIAFIWYRLNKSKGNNKNTTPPPPSDKPEINQNPEPMAPTPTHPKPYRVQNASPFSGRIIHHKSPWAIVAQGKSVGQFRKVPIPEWIRTSDNRMADYSGIAMTQFPQECVCLEVPEQTELILPPGLIYTIRS